MKKYFALSICALLLSGCKPTADEATKLAKQEISSIMKNPDSVKFSNIYVREYGSGSNGNAIYCVYGKVNGKNSFGAYSGDSPFAINMLIESSIVPFMKSKYKVANKVIVQSDVDNIRYIAISQACN